MGSVDREPIEMRIVRYRELANGDRISEPFPTDGPEYRPFVWQEVANSVTTEALNSLLPEGLPRGERKHRFYPLTHNPEQSRLNTFLPEHSGRRPELDPNQFWVAINHTINDEGGFQLSPPEYAEEAAKLGHGAIVYEGVTSNELFVLVPVNGLRFHR